MNLLTAAVKPYVPADDTPLHPFAFHILSPEREYLLQAESEAEAREWMNLLSATVSCLLTRQINPYDALERHRGSPARSTPSDLSNSPERFSPLSSAAGPLGSGLMDLGVSLTSSPSPSVDPEVSSAGQQPPPRVPSPSGRSPLRSTASVLTVLRNEVPENTICTDCGAANPDWASLNLGCLMCIECSGAHRNLGVQYSKVRSLTLDIRVWDASIVAMMRSLGNGFVSTVWDAQIQANEESDSSSEEGEEKQSGLAGLKPGPAAPYADKERYIRAKYVDRAFIQRPSDESGGFLDSKQVQELLWEAANVGEVREVYKALAWRAHVNHSFSNSSAAQLVFESNLQAGGSQDQPVSPTSLGDLTALHAACRAGNLECVELLVQSGASLEARDSFGRTPLAYAVMYSHSEVAKVLVKRGAVDTRDCTGYTSLQLLQRKSSQDFELAAMLAKSS